MWSVVSTFFPSFHRQATAGLHPWTNTDANTVAELRANLKDKSFEITEKIDSERTSIYL